MKYIAYLTEKAENDLKNICDYIETILHSPKAKSDLIEAIDDKLTKICTMPKSYRICEYPPLAVREIRYAVVKKYKLYFTIASGDNIINILYIKHELQDEQKLIPND